LKYQTTRACICAFGKVFKYQHFHRYFDNYSNTNISVFVATLQIKITKHTNTSNKIQITVCETALSYKKL